MSYQEQKQLLIKKRENLLKTYNRFFRETMEFIVESDRLGDEANTTEEKIDFITNWICQDEDNDKVIRLGAALQYVEAPQDRQVVRNLQENIKVTKKKK